MEEKAKTIILPGMPGLEWMTENLQGFGGTEIDGRTYYTWEEGGYRHARSSRNSVTSAARGTMTVRAAGSAVITTQTTKAVCSSLLRATATVGREPWRSSARRASCGLRRPTLPAVTSRAFCGSARATWAR